MSGKLKLTSVYARAGAAVIPGLCLPRPALAQIAGTAQQIAAQLALERHYPKLRITDRFLGLSIPDNTLGQTVGVAEPAGRAGRAAVFVHRARRNWQDI